MNKLQEYLSWTQKSEALSGWLEDTERSLDSCATPSSDPLERERQTLFLEVVFVYKNYHLFKAVFPFVYEE